MEDFLDLFIVVDVVTASLDVVVVAVAAVVVVVAVVMHFMVADSMVVVVIAAVPVPVVVVMVVRVDWPFPVADLDVVVVLQRCSKTQNHQVECHSFRAKSKYVDKCQRITFHCIQPVISLSKQLQAHQMPLQRLDGDYKETTGISQH